ncbi:hypothetical protein BC833DRAFT_606960 [Globomyces pollinis-pini]|nr:hypothetical protein BC833DRAFT_606960 [Globomyces pollinis-pini]
MMERGSLIIYYDGYPLSIQQAQELLNLDLSKYQVFVHLKNLGYQVFNTIKSEQNKGNQLQSPRRFINEIYCFIKYYSSLLFKNLFRWIKYRMNRPLTNVQDYSSLRNLLTDLQIVKRKEQIQECTVGDFDVYNPCSSFKRSNRGKPDYRVLVQRPNDLLPNPSILQSFAGEIPVKLAVVERMNVSFIEFLACNDTTTP